MAELKAAWEQFDTLASYRARLVEVRARSKAHYDESVGEWTRTYPRIKEIQGDLVALPRMTALRTMREQLAMLAERRQRGRANWLACRRGQILASRRSMVGRHHSACGRNRTITVDEAALRLGNGSFCCLLRPLTQTPSPPASAKSRLMGPSFTMRSVMQSTSENSNRLSRARTGDLGRHEHVGGQPSSASITA